MLTDEQCMSISRSRTAIQQQALDCGFEYWRAPDSHGVTATITQAVELLECLLGVEVDIEEQAPSNVPYSAPFTTDVPQCCGDPSNCNDPCEPGA